MNAAEDTLEPSGSVSQTSKMAQIDFVDRRPSKDLPNPIKPPAKKAHNLIDPSQVAKQKAAAKQWQMPIQRHVKKDGSFMYCTVKVRIYSGDAEKDCLFQFKSEYILATEVCNACAAKEDIHPDFQDSFKLWIVGKDLELQVKPSQNIFKLHHRWSEYMLKYTNYPECAQKRAPINNYWFVYRRDAESTKFHDFKIFSNEAATRTLYGEMKRNVLAGRYPKDDQVTPKLAGCILQIMYGDETEENTKKMMQSDVFRTIVPLKYPLNAKLKLQMIDEYKKLKGSTIHEARCIFIQEVHSNPFYGASFFDASLNLPPYGYFEYRVDRWKIGVVETGIVVIDTHTNTTKLVANWTETYFTWSPSRFLIKSVNPPNKELMALYTPQAPMVALLALQMRHNWAKEVIAVARGKTNIVNPEDMIKGTERRRNTFTRFVLPPKKSFYEKYLQPLTDYQFWRSLAETKIRKPAIEEHYDPDKGTVNLATVQKTKIYAAISINVE